MPLCRQCHFDLHGLCGLFKHYTRPRLREFQDLMVERYRALYVPPMEDECQSEEMF